MKPEQFSPVAGSSSGFSLLRQWCLLGGLSLWSGGLALVSAPVLAEPDGDVSSPTAVEAAPPVAPVETSAESLLRPQATTPPTAEPAPSVSQPAVSDPATDEAASPPVAPIEEASGGVGDFNSTVIDPTDYSLGATPSAEAPSLVFSDRSTGCQFTLQQGQSAPMRACGATASGAGASLAYRDDGSGANAGSSQESSFSLGPVTVGGNGVTIGGTTVISREYFNEKLRPLNVLRQGLEEFVFPLALPSPITSLFGWRQHPIFGDRRFHTGTDLGAPTGTPVVAAKDGEVSVADYRGGYGLMVILRHENGTQETRYAHLSRILVRPGEQVEQGEVVGLVGSTGNSTGPHLHFELRELTAQGWMLVNPNELMKYTVANLVDVINHPLQALGIVSPDELKKQADMEDKALPEMPYRPAQPNAS